MIDWVIPSQTALYIYRVGRSCPARNPFTSWISLGLLNSTRTQGPPVRPVRPTGQTVEGHRSDRWRQPDQLCSNFGCEQDVTVIHRSSKNILIISIMHTDFSVHVSTGTSCMSSCCGSNKNKKDVWYNALVPQQKSQMKDQIALCKHVMHLVQFLRTKCSGSKFSLTLKKERWNR
jgi:hypothetical protein